MTEKNLIILRINLISVIKRITLITLISLVSFILLKMREEEEGWVGDRGGGCRICVVTMEVEFVVCCLLFVAFC